MLTVIILITLLALGYQDFKERQVTLWLALFFLLLNILKIFLGCNYSITSFLINILFFLFFLFTTYIAIKLLKKFNPNLNKYKTLLGEGDILILFALNLGYGFNFIMWIIIIGYVIGVLYYFII